MKDFISRGQNSGKKEKTDKKDQSENSNANNSVVALKKSNSFNQNKSNTTINNKNENADPIASFFAIKDAQQSNHVAAQAKMEEEEPLQAKKSDEEDVQLKSNNHSTSNKMPEAVQNKMESSFGTDFSNVSIHQNSNCAKDIGAFAYTQGKDIHFAPGHYNPESQRGQELLGHELTHVIQQGQGRVQTTTQQKGMGVNDDPSLEKEADVMGKKASQGEHADMNISSINANGIQRKVAQLEDGKQDSDTTDQPAITLDGDDLFNFFGVTHDIEMKKEEAKTKDIYEQFEIEIKYEKQSREEYQAWANELNLAFQTHGISGAYEISLFLGNVFNETRGFKTLTEVKSKFASSVSKWKGRGALQLTTFGNYQAYADYLDNKDFYAENQDIMANPDLVSSNMHLAVDSAAWMWTERSKIHDRFFKGGGNPENRASDVDKIRDTMNPGEKIKGTQTPKPEFAGVRPGITGKSKQIYDYLKNKFGV